MHNRKLIRVYEILVGWLFFRIYVAIAILPPYRDLEAGDNPTIKYKKSIFTVFTALNFTKKLFSLSIYYNYSKNILYFVSWFLHIDHLHL